MKINFLELPLDERRLYLEQAALRRNVSAVILEKDFWVCWVLGVLFGSEFADALVFKGGTWLLKVFRVTILHAEYQRPAEKPTPDRFSRHHADTAALAHHPTAMRAIDQHAPTHTPHAAMHFLQSGVEANVIRSWLVHVSIATTNRYIEIDMAMKAKALATCEVTSPAPSEAANPRSPDILAWLESL